MNYAVNPASGFEEFAAVKQEIICSRSFGERLTDYNAMREAICAYAARAAEKLRGEHQYCQFISAFIKTSPFAPNEPYYANSASTKLLIPTGIVGILSMRQHAAGRYLARRTALSKSGRDAGDFSVQAWHS